MSPPVSRLAAVARASSPVPGTPGPARPEFVSAAAGPGRPDPPTLQALIAMDAVPSQAAVPRPSGPVVERAATSADGVDADPSAGFAIPTLSRAVPEPSAADTGTAGSAAAGGPAPLPAAATDVDALVRRLYDPLARRLRAELRLDRERIGRSLDLRH
jgi:hypothetical protein